MDFPLTDAGNAERFIYEHTIADGEPSEVMYVPGRGWYVWNYNRWSQDDSHALRLALATVRSIPNPEDDKSIRIHKEASESAYRLRSLLALAEDLPGVRVRADQLDNHPYLLGLKDGTIDLRTGSFSLPHLNDRITQSVATDYDAKADAPRFRQFLNEILPDPEVRSFLQRAVGYSITGSVKEEVIFLLVGKGANGKSTLVNVIRRILGSYARPIQTSLLTSRFSQGHDTDKLALQGIRFAAANETDFGDRIAEGRVKALVSTEDITARGAYQKHAATFSPSHHLWLSTNYLPNIDGSDDGLARRLIVIEFPQSFPADTRDRDLSETLQAEASGILNWMIEGAVLYHTQGLNPPQSVTQAAEEYREDMDIFSRFVEEYLEFDQTYTETNPLLWEAFSKFQFTEPHNLRIGRKSFGQAMRRKFKQINQDGVRQWPGLRVKTTAIEALMEGAGI